jgi:hypothetical protein
MSFLKAELLLVEKTDAGNKPIAYYNAPDEKKEELKEYYKLVNRYSWPMVTMYYWKFSDSERSKYDKALDEKDGIEKFIKKEVE